MTCNTSQKFSNFFDNMYDLGILYKLSCAEDNKDKQHLVIRIDFVFYHTYFSLQMALVLL